MHHVFQRVRHAHHEKVPPGKQAYLFDFYMININVYKPEMLYC
jgi:hypothetical protein